MNSLVVQAMKRLGMLRMTVLMTVASAFMSLCVAWLLSFAMTVGDLDVHLKLAFLIPFFVTPPFSYMTALSMRESRRARRAAFAMARSDPLTGVFNRRAFFEADEQARQTRTGGQSRALLFLDIDFFKRVNDTYGHEAGDAVLLHFAAILKDAMRDGDIVARFGGEEFVCVLTGAGNEQALAVAERILTDVREASVRFRSDAIRYTVSIGIAVGTGGSTTERLLADADAQLYIAKASGRDTVRILATGARHAEPVPALARLNSVAV